MPILLEDDQFVGRLNYFNMSAKPSKVYGGTIGSNYQQQGLALAKQFKKSSQSPASSGIKQLSDTNNDEVATPFSNDRSHDTAKSNAGQDYPIPNITLPKSEIDNRMSTKD